MFVLASLSTWLQHHLLQLHGPFVYLVVGGLLFLEVGIIVGFFVPGEIATIMGGVIASQHRTSLVLMLIVVWAAAVLGNFSGYEIGNVFGDRVLRFGPLKDNRHVDKAKDLLARRGGLAVVVGRWIAVVRAILPGIAGMAGMDRPVFMLWSAVGGVAWGTMWVMLGYAAGLSYVHILNAAGKSSIYVLAGVVVLVVGFVAWRKVREHRAA